MIHPFRAATIRGHRNSSADDFAECRQISLDAKKLLRGAVAQAKPGDDFIDDEQRPVPLRDFPEAFQEPAFR